MRNLLLKSLFTPIYFFLKKFKLILYNKLGMKSRLDNPLTTENYRKFSQSNEDGITKNILYRLGVESDGRCVELGVGDGRQNNSLILLQNGFKCLWVGDEKLTFTPSENGRLKFLKLFVTLKNVPFLLSQIKEIFGSFEIDLFSIDLDGNDFYITEKLLESGLIPKVVICEYNGKYQLKEKWVMPYKENFVWAGDDYYGASFSSLVNLLSKFDYFPVACSISGVNVFFVQNKFRNLFNDFDYGLRNIFIPGPNYNFVNPPANIDSTILSNLTK
jgi:hypothetical protein